MTQRNLPMKQKRNEGHKLVVARRVGERWAGTLRLGDANWYIKDG